MKEKVVSIISFTKNGDKLNKKISACCFDGLAKSFFKDKLEVGLSEWTKNAFETSYAIIFIGAAGIAVRAIAPYITSKDKDPCVLVIDEYGKFVIPVLSGHIGGGNRLAQVIADNIGGIAVITTATDINNIFAVDVWAVNYGLIIDNIENIKYISSALLRGENVGLVSDLNISGQLPQNVCYGTDFECGIVISPFLKRPFKYTLNISPEITLGVGSRKNADSNSLILLLDSLDLCKKAIVGVASIDIKKDENSILTLCDSLDCKLSFFTSTELAEVNGSFNKSDFVLKTTGVDNVCERSAVLAGNGGKLFVKKTSGSGVTIAAAADWSVSFENYNGGY